MWSLWSFGWNLLSKSVVPLGTQLHSCWGEALPPYAPSSRLLFPGQWRNGSSKTKHPSLNCLTETTGTAGGKLRLSELIRVSVLMWHLLYKQHYKAAQSINSLAWAVLVTTLHHITALSDVKCPILRSSFFLIFFNSYHISYAFICIVLLSLLIGYIKDFIVISSRTQAWSLLKWRNFWCDFGPNAELGRVHREVLRPKRFSLHQTRTDCLFVLF